jgi:hypothetical protein
MTRTREIAASGGASAAKSASALREGARIGGLAAAAVALAFAAADWVVVGDPLFTVSRLGAGIATVLGIGAVSKAGAAAGYALLHFAAFVITGVAASGVARLARKEPTVLAGALLALAVIEVGFTGLVVLLRESTFTGAFTALQLAAGNLLGAVVIGTSLWRAHPELRCELASAVGATD